MDRISHQWRVIDTGLRRAAENLAINKAMLEAHQAGEIPHTLRFLQFKPSALLGFHQSAEQELLIDYCHAQEIDIQRRITGGGAIYFDPSQIGWELYLDKKFLGTADMALVAKRICEAAADGMRRLGVDAQFRPRNDIEVNGRKISGTGGAFDGDSILYQGTLLVDFDVAKMLRILRIPAEKLSDKAIDSARDRVANLKDLLGKAPNIDEVKKHMTAAFGEAFSIEFEQSDALTEVEQTKYQQALAEIDSPEWIFQHDRPASETETVNGIYRSAGGLMRVSIYLDTAKERIKQVWITGDFFVNPKRMIVDLEAALRHTLVSEIAQNVSLFFQDYPADMLLLTADDFVQLFNGALAKQAEASTA